MEKYINYCTEEQTKRALKLGAPIYPTCYGDGLTKQIYHDDPENTLTGKSYYDIPTTQEMIGWLREEKGILVVVDGNSECAGLVKFKLYTSYFFKGDWKLYNGIKRIDNYKPNQAELAAINAALDYLENLEEK